MLLKNIKYLSYNQCISFDIVVLELIGCNYNYTGKSIHFFIFRVYWRFKSSYFYYKLCIFYEFVSKMAVQNMAYGQ